MPVVPNTADCLVIIISSIINDAAIILNDKYL